MVENFSLSAIAQRKANSREVWLMVPGDFKISAVWAEPYTTQIAKANYEKAADGMAFKAHTSLGIMILIRESY